MGIGDVNASLVKNYLLDSKEIFKYLPPELATKFEGMISVFKVVGILFIIYMVFLVASIIFNYIRNRRITKMYHKIKDIEEKVNFLVDREKKRELEEEKEKPKEKDKKK
jgi:hypothetical protein